MRPEAEAETSGEHNALELDRDRRFERSLIVRELCVIAAIAALIVLRFAFAR
jgi:hypothetical protein